VKVVFPDICLIFTCVSISHHRKFSINTEEFIRSSLILEFVTSGYTVTQDAFIRGSSRRSQPLWVTAYSNLFL